MDEKQYLKMLSLGEHSVEEKELMKENQVEFRKTLGRLMGKSRKEAKKENCYYCGVKCSGFCNSHSIPAFLIKNISVNGEVYNNNKLISLPLIDDDIGVNKAGTFRLICRDCDSTIFSDYENPDNYENKPTGKMIAQIAMKNFLKCISKRELEIPLYDNINSDWGMPTNSYNQLQNVNELDLKEFKDDFKKAKRAIEKGWNDKYYLFYYEKLDYVVPIAFQNYVSLIVDIEGNVINDIYNKSPKYTLKGIHICVFPLKTTSVLMMFIESKDKRNRRFYKQFGKLSHEDKLKAINFIIFSMSEEVYISKEVDASVINNEKLKEVCAKTPQIQSFEPIKNPIELAKENFKFSQMHDIPNLLSEDYQLVK